MIRNSFVLITLLVCHYAVNAQVLKPAPLSYQDERKNNQLNALFQPVIIERGIVFSDIPNTPPFSSTCDMKCTLPRGAIFCRMEDAIYNRLNFWVKFRMGTEDRYSN